MLVKNHIDTRWLKSFPKEWIWRNKIKLNMYSPSGHSKCRWVCLFMWTDLALCHLLTNESTTVNGCRQNESPNSWYKHLNNPQFIHMTPVHQLMSCEVESCVFVRNKSIITVLRTVSCRFLPKYQLIIQNNKFPPMEKSNVVLLCQNPLTYLFRTVLDCFCF